MVQGLLAQGAWAASLKEQGPPVEEAPSLQEERAASLAGQGWPAAAGDAP